MATDLIIRPAGESDVPAISRIYNHYIEHTTATFRIQPETEAERLDWLRSHTGRFLVLVAEQSGSVAAWASLSPYSTREGYRYTAEDSIYVDEAFLGRGIGKALFAALIEAGCEAGFRAIIARVSTTQGASVALHRKAGFVDVGILRGVGEKFGKLLDVSVMQYTYGSVDRKQYTDLE